MKKTSNSTLTITLISDFTEKRQRPKLDMDSFDLIICPESKEGQIMLRLLGVGSETKAKVESVRDIHPDHHDTVGGRELKKLNRSCLHQNLHKFRGLHSLSLHAVKALQDRCIEGDYHNVLVIAHQAMNAAMIHAMRVIQDEGDMNMLLRVPATRGHGYIITFEQHGSEQNFVSFKLI